MLGYYTDWIVCQAEEKPQMIFFRNIVQKSIIIHSSIRLKIYYEIVWIPISHQWSPGFRALAHSQAWDGWRAHFFFFLFFYFGFQFLGILEKGELEFAVPLWKIRKWRHYSRQHWLRRWHMSTQKGASCSLMTLLWSCLLISRLSLPCSHYQTLAFP